MREIKAKVPLLVFEEGDKYIAYSPALDISSCGDTQEDARNKFGEAVDIFLSEIRRMGTFDEVMEECGWRKLSEGKGWIPPVYTTTEESISLPV